MHNKLSLAVTVMAALSPATALATNGYFMHGYGTINQGMAGAGTALSQDSMAAATNPAGMAFVGNRLDGGLEVISARPEYTVEGPLSPPPVLSLQPGIHKASRKTSVIPQLGFNRELSDTTSFGISVFANGGMNTDYSGENGGPFYGGSAGASLEQLAIAPTWSWKFSDNQAVGISPIITYQRFEAKGLKMLEQYSSDPNALSNNGTDDAWGYGFQIGWQGKITDTLRGGVSWRSTQKMNKFDKYRGLLAKQGDFDIPQVFNGGLAWSGLEDHWFLLDIQHIHYSDINSFGNPLLPNFKTTQLGDDNGAGFGWDDMTIVKLGWQWQQTPSQAWRTGVSHGKNPISSEDVLLNIMAPGTQEWHFTGGFTHSFSENLEVSGMAYFSPAKKVSGPNPLAANQTIEVTMSQQLGASVSVGWKY
jgi:long-chain fatty acid transport protein